MFLYNNYDILLLSVQALNPYAIDKLTDKSFNINIIELFIIRTNSIMRYSETSHYHKLYYIFVMTQSLSLVLSNINIQQQTKEILREVTKKNHTLSQYSNTTYNYIKRFIVSYRQYCAPYLIGHQKYRDDTWIIQLSIINLFLIYKLYDIEGIYFIFFYLIYNYKQV
uniref:Uncharacterized protein n=1 Tax=Trichogloeopsis pedicellata TaxID=1495610 RepID=A0A1G4P0T9_9FLOR|nr:Hypothetical protein ORF_6 [Trichogloeopsis pedicellata]SCW24504.1 Hypothetical protein ORF_6 [Trichogloeopsis pedicellata]